jgi:hypothetical protein
VQIRHFAADGLTRSVPPGSDAALPVLEAGTEGGEPAARRAGPADPESAKFYEADGIHLKVGKTTGPTKVGFDLPRGAGNTAAKKRKAIIPDPRNDETSPWLRRTAR